MRTAVFVVLAIVSPVCSRGEVLLQCHFNDNAVGVGGETPKEGRGLKFVEGRVGTPGLHATRETFLSFETAGNLNLHEGTFSLWMKPLGWHGSTDKQVRDILFLRVPAYWDRNAFCVGKNYQYSVCVTFWDDAKKPWQVYVRPDEVFIEDQWVHLAVTWRLSEGSLTLYANGVPKKTLAARALINIAEVAPTFSVGNRADYPLEAVLDELTIWDTCLSPEEVLADFRKPIAEY